MIYIVIGLLTIFFLIKLIFNRGKKRYAKEMSLAQEIIFFNTAEYLFNKNRNDYPDDDSCMKIMAAVTNKIYGRDPTDEEALKFAQTLNSKIL